MSVDIIDQCVAQGVPFAREYGGLLDNRSFGGAQVSRTFYARGQTGQQLLLGAYQALARAGRPRATWSCTPAPRCSTWSWSTAGPPASWCATSSTGEISSHSAHAVVLATGGYSQRLLPVDQRHGLQHHGDLAGPPPRRLLRQPVLHPDPPDLHPAERRVPVEAHADVGVAPQRRPHLGAEEPRRHALARPDPRGPSATTSSSASTRRSATSCRATWPAATPRR